MIPHAGERIADATDAWHDMILSEEIRERREREATLPDARVWHVDAAGLRRANHAIAPYEDIEIDRARPPADLALAPAAEESFDLAQRFGELARLRLLDAQQHRAVHERRLLGADRSRAIQRRGSNVTEAGEGFACLAEPRDHRVFTADVAAEPDRDPRAAIDHRPLTPACRCEASRGSCDACTA